MAPGDFYCEVSIPETGNCCQILDWDFCTRHVFVGSFPWSRTTPDLPDGLELPCSSTGPCGITANRVSVTTAPFVAGVLILSLLGLSILLLLGNCCYNFILDRRDRVRARRRSQSQNEHGIEAPGEQRAVDQTHTVLHTEASLSRAEQNVIMSRYVAQEHLRVGSIAHEPELIPYPERCATGGLFENGDLRNVWATHPSELPPYTARA
ncbi:hypothetical protein F5B20DRAFT_574896 [Whalleya microplaca]|nr:hypothetical protein F5B20DRAFT_574896 [Whalleya microplaca]